MSTSDTIYEQLRQAIIEGTFSSGEPLRQVQIAKDYGVSKSPLREALLQHEKVLSSQLSDSHFAFADG